MSERDAAELRSSARRLALQFTVLMVVVLALMGIVLYSIVAASTSESLARSLEDATRVDSPRDASPGVFVAFSGHDGNRESSSRVPGGLPDLAAMERVAATGVRESGTFSAGGRSYQVLTVVRGEHVVQSAIDTHESREALERLGWGMAVSGAAATLMAAGLSVVMANRAMRPLAASLAQQRRFVADASHELRTPLTLLSTRAQLLRRKLGGAGYSLEQSAVEVSRIVEDSKLLQEILDDLLISSDPRSTADYAPVDLNDIARTAVSLAGPGAEERCIVLELDIPEGPVMVTGSGVALLRVATSLVSNALDYAKKSVAVGIAVEGSDACIRVGDDGPGFPEGFKAAAFNRFASARPVTHDTGAPRHYGLGLALVAEIAVLHRGKVVIESGPAGGAAVKVILPMVKR